MELPERINQLALKIIKYAQSELLIKMRFLSAALFGLKYTPSHDFPSASFAVNGADLYYNPAAVISVYKSDSSLISRNLLHTVFHCVFHHPFIIETINRNLWDLSCDIAVERAITELGISSLSGARDNNQSLILEPLINDIKPFTAEKIYRYFLDNPGISKVCLESAKLFFADDHSLWYNSKNANGGGNADKINSFSRGELKSLWKRLAERIQVDMETFSKEQGDSAGTMMQNIKDIMREKYDYSAFLRRFSVLGEAIGINDDEYDYIFYTYGLRLYKKMPLIEPLEYKETHLIKDFVIAIDTSGSVKGELVRRFMQKTYNILKQCENFFTRINLYFIQCDAEIQEIVKITQAEEFELYLKTAVIKGLGGTDFRPVFRYVNNMIEQGELPDLRGLIYFTDGYGTFPERKPAYDAAFVFVDEISGDFIQPSVPPWAIKLILKPEEL